MEKGKILVVDDQAIVREVMVDILTQAGHQTASVGNGEDALDMLGKESFDVLLTDIVMPGMNGLDLVSEAHQVSPTTVSILITAYPSVDSIDQAIAHLGAHDYLLKPVDKNKLCDAVTKAIKRKRIKDY